MAAVPPLPRLAEPLSDGVVALREFTDGDVDAMAEALQDPELARWTRVPVPYTREHAAAYIAGLDAARERGDALTFAVVTVADDRPIGSITLRFSWPDRRAEIGSVFYPGARGQGLGPRAGRLLFPYAFGPLGIARIGALADVRNEVACQAIEKAGFRREGVLRSYVRRDGERIDLVSFSLLPADL